jgi:hypothetical protein
VLRVNKLTTFMCRLSWNLGASNSRKLQGLSRDCFTCTSIFLNVAMPTSYFISTYRGQGSSWAIKRFLKGSFQFYLPVMTKYFQVHKHTKYISFLVTSMNDIKNTICDFVRLLLWIIKVSINLDEFFVRIYVFGGKNNNLIVFLSWIRSDIEM